MELCELCGEMLLDFEIEKYGGLCKDCWEENKMENKDDYKEYPIQDYLA